MKPVFVLLVLLRSLLIANTTPSLPVNPGGIGGLYKGPNSETIIKGPDGSIITAAAEGGEVYTKLDPIIVAEHAPAIVAVSEPDLIPATVLTAPIPAVQTVEVNAPIIEPSQPASDLVGPSGTISTRGSSSVVAGPASTTYTGPTVLGQAVVKGPPIIGDSAQISTLGGAEIVGSIPLSETIGITSVTGSPIIETSGGPLISSTLSPLLELGAPDILPPVGPIISSTAVPIQSLTVTAAPPLALDSLSVSPGLRSIATATAIPPLPTDSLSISHRLGSLVTASAGPSLTIDSLSNSHLGSIATASASDLGGIATASVSPHQSIATASATSNGIASANATSNLAIASIKSLDNLALLPPSTPLPPVLSTPLPPLHTLSSTLLPPVSSTTPYPVLPSTGLPTISSTPLLINGGPRISINGQVDLADTNRINLGRSPILTSTISGTNIITSDAIRNSPDLDIALQTSSIAPIPLQSGVNLVSSQTSIPIQSSTLVPNSAGTILSSTLSPDLVSQRGIGVGPIVNSAPIQRGEIDSAIRPQIEIGQRIEPIQRIPLSRPEQLALAQQQALLRNDIGNPFERSHLVAREIKGPLAPNTISTLSATEEQALLNAELAKAGIDPSQLKLTNVPLEEVVNPYESNVKQNKKYY